MSTAVEWTRDSPVADGIYFRINAGHRIQRHMVSNGHIDWGWSGEQTIIPVSSERVKGWSVGDTVFRWWWLGPLPFPPQEAEAGNFDNLYSYATSTEVGTTHTAATLERTNG